MFKYVVGVWNNFTQLIGFSMVVWGITSGGHNPSRTTTNNRTREIGANWTRNKAAYWIYKDLGSVSRGAVRNPFLSHLGYGLER